MAEKQMTTEKKRETQALLLGRYEIGKLLGHGTFAKVYHARNIKSGENVAIKVLDKEKILKVGLMAHIKREISILRRVRHPNIVQLFEVMATKAKIYFVMEYVKGGELFNKVAKGRLKEEVARKYFQQLISAVQFCHARGVFHRDLKPENLLLDENGDLKVSDFGLPQKPASTVHPRVFQAPKTSKLQFSIMRTRKAETPKSGATKKTPVKKTTDKTPTKSSEASTAAASPKTATPSPTTTTTTTTPITTASKQPKSAGASKAQTPKTAPKAELKAEEASASVETPKTGAKKTKTVVKKVVKPSPKAVAVKTTPKANEKSLKKEASKVEETNEEEEPVVENVEEAEKEEEIVAESPKKEEPVVDSVMESKEVESEPVEEEVEDDKEVEEEGDAVDMEEDGTGEELEADEDDGDADEGMEEDGEEGFVEPEIEEGAEDDVEADEEAGRLEEHMEISAAAKERRKKKELEIFIGGLDRDAVEDDVKKVFDKFGEILEVRMHRNQSTNKNKGYAFVKFATKEQATQALNELKNPIICGKRCGTAPSEDNDTLFVGNICNTWTKEAIKKKLKEFGLEGVENITLVPDAQHEGVSRGFAFVGFSCHADAMLAYKRLQKPDVIFGHAERTVKVAFAEPIREPDPEVMAQVKSVFVDGLPPHWDEERVREHFQPHGEIERIVLARNMSTAKRKDFGFVDFTTHEAAMACIDGVNNTELGEGKSKAKVKVRLANPAPKTQAVKGGLCGGFRIGRANSGFSRFGKGFGRGGRPFDRTNDQRSRDSYVRERGRTGRFMNEESKGGSYSGSRGRRPFPERGQKRDTADYFPRDAPSTRSGGGRSRNIAAERGPGKSIHSRRQPYSSEGRFSRPVGGRNYVDDRYQYEDSSYGLKRSYSMLDNEPEYLEPIRMRPRFDHPDSVAASREARYQDSYGPRAGLYPHDYYGSTYGSSSYPSMYGGDRSYGGGYYY